MYFELSLMAIEPAK